MDVATLKARMKSKNLPDYLIFSGPEWKVQQIYIDQIAKITGKQIIRIDNVSETFSRMRGKALQKNANIYIVRDDKDLMQNEKLQAQIDSGVLKDNMLIHILTTTDKRTKFYKKYKDKIIEFEPLSDAMLKKYIKKEINLSDRNCDRLIEICEHDYGRCLLEINKIKIYTRVALMSGDNSPKPFDMSFEQLLADGTIYVPAKDSIFDFVDEVLNRRCNNLFELLQECYDSGEATMMMLTVLYNNAKAVLQVQSYQGDNLSKSTGLNGWQIKNAKAHLHKYTNKELINMLQLIQQCESGIKTGQIEEPMVMQYILAKVI